MNTKKILTIIGGGNFFNVARGVLLFTSFVFFTLDGYGATFHEAVPAEGTAVNFLCNPGAEKQIPAAQTTLSLWNAMTHGRLELSDTVPEDWGVCSDWNLKILWGATDKEAHSGRYSCFLKVLDRLTGKDTDPLRVRIMFGKSNGSGKQAMKPEPEKEYFYSFWVKGDVQEIEVRVFIWSDDEGKKLIWAPALTTSELGAEWKQISGTFKPPANAKRMVVTVRVLKAKAGQSVYVDDAVVGFNSQATRALAEATVNIGKGDKTNASSAPKKLAPRLRVLYLGNSQMEQNQLPMMIKLLSQSAPPDCPRIDFGQVLLGGYGLKKYWEAGEGPKSPRGKIASAKWDYVVFQPSVVDTSEILETYGMLFYEAIKKTGAKTILFATAGQSKKSAPQYIYPESFLKLNDMQMAFRKKHGVIVAPAGCAWIRYLGPNPSEDKLLDLYAPDKAHPGGKGTYIYACMLYAIITGRSPVGLVHDIKVIPIDYVYGKTLSIDPKEAKRMQQAAWDEYLEKCKKK
jgi:hypothetical protein